METKLVVFQDKGIRKILHNGEWWFQSWMFAGR